MNTLKPCDIKRILSLPLGKRIDQALVEKWSQSLWKVSQPEKVLDARFTIMFPPPNITGNLHLGHALTATIQDALLRHRCMSGYRGLWIPGFDHAGLATQKIVEGLLWRKTGKNRKDCSQSEVMELANEWKDLKRNEMKNQLNELGLALDYSKEYFTMDEKSSLAVSAAFKKLFESGKIYRALRSVYWSNELQTTLSDIEVNIVDGVARYFRTDEIVEKRNLSQWYVDSSDMAHRAVEVVNDCAIDIIPENYKNSWSSWLINNGVKDWCISRQSWWGHKIPAYKLKSKEDKQENWIVAENLEEAKTILGFENDIEQDSDVLDTWFSSSLLPLTVSGWPSKEKFSESLEKGTFPLDIMETGFDILSYWVSKMVMMSCALENKVPFKLILLHGMICDGMGKKMSKSKGNVIDPLNIIRGASLTELLQNTKDLHEKGVIEENQLEAALNNQKKLFPKGIPCCGADGLRAYLLSHDFQEEVVRVQISQIDKIRRLSNKIWNIFRYVLLILEDFSDLKLKIDHRAELIQSENLSQQDKQVLTELAKCVTVAHISFSENYRLHSCFNTLELFWTVHLSANYISNIKTLLASKDKAEKSNETQLQIIVTCLSTATKLLHPFMPHMTEFLYQKLAASLNRIELNVNSFGNLKSLRDEPFPKVEDWSLYKLN